MTDRAAPVLLYDGVCGFCNNVIQFILHHEVRHSLRFAPLQGQYAAGLKLRHPEVGDVDSVVWVEGEGPSERVFIRSDAALKATSYMGGFWKLLGVLRVIPRVVRDFCYDWFARHRYRWFGKYSTCPVPSREIRSRFLD
ncbi:MAG: DCC1-like thiol-disulfide oxidoreductase family protein [Gemmatimonadota bacterium]